MPFKRTGAETLRKTAILLCRYVNEFSPTIKKAFPDNATLQAALLAANVACETLALELEAVKVYGD